MRGDDADVFHGTNCYGGGGDHDSGRFNQGGGDHNNTKLSVYTKNQSCSRPFPKLPPGMPPLKVSAPKNSILTSDFVSPMIWSNVIIYRHNIIHEIVRHDLPEVPCLVGVVPM